jgi:hypothetical protein
MAQRTPIDYIREFISPILIAIIGYYSMTTLNEIRSDVKTLLETSAKHTEQIRSLERKVFGMVSIDYNYLKIIFDKNKTLKYKDGVFDYM